VGWCARHFQSRAVASVGLKANSGLRRIAAFGYDCHSGAIITASVILMNFSFWLMDSWGASHVVGNLRGSTLLDPIRELHDGDF
jgi:hypothetical protein